MEYIYYSAALVIGFILGYYFRDSVEFVMLKARAQYDRAQERRGR